MDVLTGNRYVCTACEVYATSEDQCWCCGQIMDPAIGFVDPTTGRYITQMLGWLNR